MTVSCAQADAEIPLPRLRTISQLWTCAAVLAAMGVAALAVLRRVDREALAGADAHAAVDVAHGEALPRPQLAVVRERDCSQG